MTGTRVIHRPDYSLGQSSEERAAIHIAWLTGTAYALFEARQAGQAITGDLGLIAAGLLDLRDLLARREGWRR